MPPPKKKGKATPSTSKSKKKATTQATLGLTPDQEGSLDTSAAKAAEAVQEQAEAAPLAEIKPVSLRITSYMQAFHDELIEYMDVGPSQVYWGIPKALDLIAKLRELGKEAMVYVLTFWPTPEWAVKPLEKGRQKFYYVPIPYVRRLLHAFFPGSWGVRRPEYVCTDQQVICHGEFWVRWPDGTENSMWGVGKSDIRFLQKDPTIPVSLGDNYKAAKSDLIKKCANELLGIADDVYSGTWAAHKERELEQAAGSREVDAPEQQPDKPPTLSKKNPLGHLYKELERLGIKTDRCKGKAEAHRIIADHFTEINKEPVDPKDVHFGGKSLKTLQEYIGILWQWRQDHPKEA